MIGVFVYGTLKRGHPLNDWMKSSTYIQDVKISGYRMIDMGAYPGIIKTGVLDHEVEGEYWQMSDSAFKSLEDMEHNVGYTTEVEDIYSTANNDRLGDARTFCYLDWSNPCLQAWEKHNNTTTVIDKEI